MVKFWVNLVLRFLTIFVFVIKYDCWRLLCLFLFHNISGFKITHVTATSTFTFLLFIIYRCSFDFLFLLRRFMKVSIFIFSILLIDLLTFVLFLIRGYGFHQCKDILFIHRSLNFAFCGPVG